MLHNYRYALAAMCVAAFGTNILYGIVDDIAGDAGSAQSGSITLSGGTTGIVFDSSASSNVTATMDYLNLPLPSTTAGYISMGEEVAIHKFPLGNDNFFVGSYAGNFTITSAFGNAGCGYAALNGLTTGNHNAAMGHAALGSLTGGSQNTAIGQAAGSGLTTGSGNIFIGKSAGGSYTGNETGNIIVGSNNGIAEEQMTIRIGDGQTQQHCYVDGIYGSIIELETALPVYADQFGKLGTETSILSLTGPVVSANISESSKLILKLNPLAFIFRGSKKMFKLDPAQVAKILPDLVVNSHGCPAAVKYQDLQVLMLDHQQNQDARVAKLENVIQKLLDKVNTLENRILSLLRTQK